MCLSVLPFSPSLKHCPSTQSTKKHVQEDGRNESKLIGLFAITEQKDFCDTQSIKEKIVDKNKKLKQ